jgi:dihydrofolate synthase/folylpolyglutamate synthase
MNDLSYSEAISFLYGLQRFGMKLGLERMGAFLSRLGNPQDAFASIHVAGTNGKGSTCFFLESVLRETGLAVGLYTSPHLLRFEERIVTAGKEIEKDYIAGWISREGEHIVREALTFFEAATAMAFCCFRDTGVELAVCEVGLGGRLDATNVLRPRCAVITSIGIDHTEQLGTTKESIALEKLGIVKEGVPVVTGEADAGILALHREVAHARGARLRVLEEEVCLRLIGCSSSGTSFDYDSPGFACEGLEVPLVGPHQARNAALALLSIETALGPDVLDEAAVRRGLAGARAPGRFEIVETPRGTVVLDAGHNPAAMEVLVRTCGAVFPGQRPVVVIGMSSEKDVEGVLAILAPLAAEFIVTEPDYRRHDRKARAARLLPVARAVHGRVREEPDPGSAVAQGLESAAGGNGDYVLVTGSFYTVAGAMEYLGAAFQHKGETA